MAKHRDFLVVNGDFEIDAAGYVRGVVDNASIGQDIKHRLIESGLVLALIGQRSPVEQAKLTNQILIEVDKDDRLEPGSATLYRDSVSGQYWLTALTLDYGLLKLVLS